ncbi:MAG: NADH-quinone oxidoreductase subunit N [candidate division Zixibacteria bacterium SM23_73_2]|nr:MAG: NADH-quinone oxidoreductase subunit N [candidate division Zixibacteria bacterium SM23_73_2]
MSWILPDINFQILLPELVILVFALLILILEPILKGRAKEIIPHISWVGILLALLSVISLWNREGMAFNQMFLLDNFSCFFKIIFLSGAFLVILSSISYLKEEKIFHGEYFSLILFATFGMMLMASSLNLIVIFLGLEIMSLCLYILVGFRRYDLKSNESSMKYFLIGAFASGFLLYGIAMLYGATHSVNLKEILTLIITGGYESQLFLFIGLGLILVGLGFKIASFPFHMWVPDVYQGAPIPITAFVSSGPKAAGFAALLRILLFAFSSLQFDWSALLWILAVLTMTFGNVVALSQTNIKRLLAYSSIAHAGYILVALVAGGGSGISSAMFYLLAYTFMNVGAFVVIIFLGEKKVNLDDYSGLAASYPVLGVALALFMFSLAGFPPTAGFMAKFYVFSAAVKSGYFGLAIIGVLNSFVSVYYYLRVVVIMFMRVPEEEGKRISVPFFLSLALFFTVWGTLYLGILPQSFLNLAQSSIFSAF